MNQQNLIYVQGQEYSKGNQIGSGGYAVIYNGENTNTKEKVAIRVANDMTEDEYNIHQILIQQKKKFLIDIKGLEYNETNGTIVIVMELGKEDFHSFMKKNEYQQFTKLNKNLVFHNMVSAVLELHELNYFHRDLKPENFIIIKNSNNDHPNIKLIDFGLCKHLQNKNRLTQNAGTILFMAPEVMGSDKYDKTSDIWSLGCIYFEIMTSKPFIEGTTYQGLVNTLQNIQQNQINQKIDQFEEMNLNEKNLLKSMLQREPNQRLTLKDILQKLDSLTQRNFQPIQQGKSSNNFPNNPIQLQQFPQWSIQQQQQLQDARLQTQIKNVINQKYQKQLQEDIAKFKIESNEQQQEQILKKQKEIEQKNEQDLNQLAEEIKQKYDQQIQQNLQDKEKLKDLQIAFELETQKRLNQQKIQQEQELKKNLDSFQQQIKEDYDKQLEQSIKQQKINIEAQIETEQKQIFEEKMKELKNKQLQDENKQKQMQIETKKQSIQQVMACYVEVLSKNQKIIIEKQKILEKLEQSNQIQATQISLKVKAFLKDYQKSLLEANQVKQSLQNINDINQLYQLEKEYSEKVTQQSINLFKNIKQIDQEIQNLNRFDKQIIVVGSDYETEQNKLSELKTNLNLKLSYLQNQLNQMKQSANAFLQGSQEYEAVQLIQRFTKEIESLTQLEFKFKLIKNQFEQVKDMDLFKLGESLYELSQQCSEIEKQFKNEKVILETNIQEFKRNEQSVIEQLDNLLSEVENQFNENESKLVSFRQKFQNLKFQKIDECEIKHQEIQNLIKKIYFSRQQFYIKKQKQIFNLIEQNFEEFNIQYKQVIRQEGYYQALNICKQQSDDIKMKLLEQKQHFQFQIANFQLQFQNLRFNQQQLNILNILNDYFKYYVQKCEDFQYFSNDTTKHYQLSELNQSLNEQKQFYEESGKKFKVLFEQAKNCYQNAEISYKLENEKWSQFNDLCQKLHQFQQLSKDYQFSKDISFCEYLRQLQTYQDLLTKYENHFQKFEDNSQKSEKIGQELKAKLEQNLDKFKKAQEQNLKQIQLIKHMADKDYKKMKNFLESIFKVHKDKIKFKMDSVFYEEIYQSFQSYLQIISQVDFINSEIQNYYSKEYQQDNTIFFNDTTKTINEYLIKLKTIKESLNQLDEVKFQKDKKCFIKLIFFLIVIQLQILAQINERQLTHQEQLERKKIQNISMQKQFQQNNDQKLSEFQIKRIQYEDDQIKFQQFLSLNEQYLSDEYQQLVQDNDKEIEKQFHDIFIKDRAKLRGMIKDQAEIKNILDYCQSLEFSRFIIQKQIETRIN